MLALTGALGFSFVNVCVRNGVRAGDPDNGLLITMSINVASFAFLGVIIILTGNGPLISAEATAWFVAAGLAANFLGRQALFAGIRHIGAARAAALKNGTPLVTVMIALTFLGERLSIIDGLGVGLILVGLGALIVESLQTAPAPLDGLAPERDPIDSTLAIEAMVEGGLWDRSRDLAGRTISFISEPSRRRVVFGVALGLLAAIFFGSGHALRKVGMDLMPSAVIGGLIGATTALIAYLATETVKGDVAYVVRSAVGTARPWYWAAGAAGTVGQLSFLAALAFAPVSHVSVIGGSETVLTVIIAAVLAGRLEVITRRVVLPAILVFAGTALIAVASA